MAKDKDKKSDNKKDDVKKTGQKPDTKSNKKSEKKPEKKPEKKDTAKKPDKKAPAKADKKAPAKSEPKKVVQPADQKAGPGQIMDMEDLKQKGQALILKHPEILNNARGLFRNENGRTIVQDRVPRGDVGLSKPLCHSDLKDEDLRGLAVFASTLIDPDLSKYDTKCAQEDALTKAIDKKDGGKYAGLINASSYALILDNMGSIKKAADEKEIEIPEELIEEKVEEQVEEEKKPTGLEKGKENVKRQIEKVKERKEEAPKEEAPKEEPKKEEPKKEVIPEDKETESKEAGMDKQEMLHNEREELFVKLAAVETLLADGGVEKTANLWMDSMAEARAAAKPGTSFKDIATAAKPIHEKKKKEKEAAEEVEEKDVEEKTTEAADKEPKEVEDAEVKLSSTEGITAALDDIAGALQDQNDEELFKIAYQIDAVSDVIDGTKEAATLESDPDEGFMKKYFQAGVRKADGDEKFMKEFDNDNTKEVAGVVGKKASELPYQKKDD